jgi:proline dehydrogenase
MSNSDPLTSFMLNHLLFLFARRFVAGLTMEEAVRAVRGLNQTGIRATLDVLGENVHLPQSADMAVRSYLLTLDSIQKSGIDSNVSLKLTQMGLDISQALCLENLEKICKEATACDNFVRIDMEGSDYTDRSLDVFEKLFRVYPNVGIVLQAYLRRTDKDLERILNLGARVRLCKGAYKEPPAMALQSMDEIRTNFCRLASRLLRQGNYPAIATHDDFLISWTKQYAKEQRIDSSRFEFQMLYGLRAETQKRMIKEGYQVRVYVPYGTHWLPYFYRRLRERKENVFFVFKNLLKK